MLLFRVARFGVAHGETEIEEPISMPESLQE